MVPTTASCRQAHSQGVEGREILECILRQVSESVVLYVPVRDEAVPKSEQHPQTACHEQRQGMASFSACAEDVRIVCRVMESSPFDDADKKSIRNKRQNRSIIWSIEDHLTALLQPPVARALSTASPAANRKSRLHRFSTALRQSSTRPSLPVP